MDARRKGFNILGDENAVLPSKREEKPKDISSATRIVLTDITNTASNGFASKQTAYKTSPWSTYLTAPSSTNSTTTESNETAQPTQPTQPTTQPVLNTDLPVAKVCRSLGPRHYKSLPQLGAANRPCLRRTKSQIISTSSDGNARTGLLFVLDSEEFWEEEDETYDEDYSVPNTALFPRITYSVKRELCLAKDLVDNLRTAEEIEEEQWNIKMVPEYGDEIFHYMRELEMKMLPNANYIDCQSEIQWPMRSLLMDWLIQVHCRFSLLPETLFLGVNYIDRFLSCHNTSSGKLQLIGATAIFIAAKYEEITCPSVQEIVYMVDGGYTVNEILTTEKLILSTLKYDLGWPGPMSFLRRISKADDYELKARTLAKYFMEVTIMDYRFISSPPSFIAAGAYCLACKMLNMGYWVSSGLILSSCDSLISALSTAHVYYSGYIYAQLEPLVTTIIDCCENPQIHHTAVYEKYSDRRYKFAAEFVRKEMEKGFTPQL